MFARFKNRLEITGILHTVTALRVSAGRSLEPIGSDLPVIKDALGRPLIPGSSFKGALRSRLESFLRGVFSEIDADQLRHLVANPANENEWSITSKEMQGFKNSYSDRQLTQVIIEHTDLVSLVFGSPWLSSKFQVRDLTIFDPENNWFGSGRKSLKVIQSDRIDTLMVLAKVESINYQDLEFFISFLYLRYRAP